MKTVGAKVKLIDAKVYIQKSKVKSICSKVARAPGFCGLGASRPCPNPNSRSLNPKP